MHILIIIISIAGLKPSKSWIQADEKEHFKTGSIDDHKAHKHSPSSDHGSGEFVPRARYTAFLINVKQGDPQCELDQWPEENERKRLWVSYEDALKEIKWRKDIYQLLLQAEGKLKQYTNHE